MASRVRGLCTNREAKANSNTGGRKDQPKILFRAHLRLYFSHALL
jgi:hypothetical protein